MQDERRKRPGRIKITKRIQVRGKVEVEELIEVDLPISDDIQKKIDNAFKEHLKMKNRDNGVMKGDSEY